MLKRGRMKEQRMFRGRIALFFHEDILESSPSHNTEGLGRRGTGSSTAAEENAETAFCSTERGVRVRGKKGIATDFHRTAIEETRVIKW